MAAVPPPIGGPAVDSPLNRLRRVLQSQYTVGVESSAELVAAVTRRADARRQEFINKGKQPPPAKQPAVFQPLPNRRDWAIRPIDLLHKIGELTTPRNVNYSKLSASWATRRYFWAIAEPDGDPAFRLSQDARELDFHQKTLLSDEFGIGMAGLFAESYLGTDEFVDVSIALDAPEMYQGIQQVGTAQPDFCMWCQSDMASPLYIVECKGSQTNRNVCIEQLRRGLEQVPAVVFANGPRPTVSLVIGTFLNDGGTSVFVLDPPADEEEPRREKFSEKTDQRTWRITEPEAFQKRIWMAHESHLLKWAGQMHDAAAIDQNLLPGRAPQLIARNATLVRKETEVGAFSGVDAELFPELGQNGLRIFRGVEEELLASLREAEEKAEQVGLAIRRRVLGLQERLAHQLPPTISLHTNGTCTIIDGLY